MRATDAPRASRADSLAGLRRIEADFLRARRGPILLALIGLIAHAVLALPVPVLQGRVIDELAALFHRAEASAGAIVAVHGPHSSADARPSRVIVMLLLTTAACHVARLILGWKVWAMMSRITLEIVRELTDTLHRKLQRLGMSYFDREATGCIMARLTSDVGSLLLFLSGGSLQLVSDLVLAAGISAFLFWLEWRLALVGMLVMPLFVLNHRRYFGPIHELSRASREQVSALYTLLSERISAVRVVRSFAREEAELAEFDAALDRQRDLGWAGMKAVANQGAWSSLINGLGIVAVLAGGAILIQGGRLTVGELLAFSALLSQLYQPIVRLAGAQAMIAGTMVAVDRIVEVLDEPETEAPGRGVRRIHRPGGSLSYRGVSFTYPRGGRKVLDGINLTIEPGMRVGVMGASGSGKSTLLALAPRIYGLAEGEGAIFLDGQDIRGIDLTDLRRAVALVPQQAMLFEGTIRSNLIYASPHATPDAIGRALEISDLAGYVASLPMGLDTPVGERGHTLSGGQRQRLALARALIADPAVLLLDDCTSAVDPETELRIHTALEDHALDQTRIIVSHKVSSARDADRIIILDEGRIVEEGSHAALIRRGGTYATLYRQQTSSLAASSWSELVPDSLHEDGQGQALPAASA